MLLGQRSNQHVLKGIHEFCKLNIPLTLLAKFQTLELLVFAKQKNSLVPTSCRKHTGLTGLKCFWKLVWLEGARWERKRHKRETGVLLRSKWRTKQTRIKVTELQIDISLTSYQLLSYQQSAGIRAQEQTQITVYTKPHWIRVYTKKKDLIQINRNNSRYIVMRTLHI